MKYNRFEELPVWQAAMTPGERIFAITRTKAFGGKGDLRSQLQRAASRSRSRRAWPGRMPVQRGLGAPPAP